MNERDQELLAKQLLWSVSNPAERCNSRLDDRRGIFSRHVRTIGIKMTTMCEIATAK
jgi:hypothetical protein